MSWASRCEEAAASPMLRVLPRMDSASPDARSPALESRVLIRGGWGNEMMEAVYASAQPLTRGFRAEDRQKCRLELTKNAKYSFNINLDASDRRFLSAARANPLPAQLS